MPTQLEVNVYVSFSKGDIIFNVLSHNYYFISQNCNSDGIFYLFIYFFLQDHLKSIDSFV